MSLPTGNDQAILQSPRRPAGRLPTADWLLHLLSRAGNARVANSAADGTDGTSLATAVSPTRRRATDGGSWLDDSRRLGDTAQPDGTRTGQSDPQTVDPPTEDDPWQNHRPAPGPSRCSDGVAASSRAAPPGAH